MSNKAPTTADSLISDCAWLGGKTAADAREWVKSNKLRLRAGSVGILDTAKGTYQQRPVIEVARPGSRKYYPLEMADTPWFASRAERDAVLEAITAPV